jgi:hypothetical protein
MIEISIQHRQKEDTYWTNHRVLGMWKRQGEGEDGKTEVYFPEHRKNWDVAYGAEYGFNPDGLPQTKIVLNADEVRYIGELTT